MGWESNLTQLTCGALKRYNENYITLKQDWYSDEKIKLAIHAPYNSSWAASEKLNMFSHASEQRPLGQKSSDQTLHQRRLSSLLVEDCRHCNFKILFRWFLGNWALLWSALGYILILPRTFVKYFGVRSLHEWVRLQVDLELLYGFEIGESFSR